MGNFADFFTMITAVASAFAVLAAWRTVLTTRETYQAQIIMELSNHYSSPEMLSALLSLTNWFKSNPKEFAVKFIQLRKDDYPTVEKLDQNRRFVKSYFSRIYRLHLANLLQEKIEKSLLQDQPVRVLLQIIEPMEKF